MRFSEFKITEGVFEPAIRKIQKFLISKGYDLGPAGADGINGPYTKAAIAKYMKGQPAKEPGTTTGSDTPNTPASNDTKPDTTSTTGGDIMPTKGTITGTYGRMVTGPKGNKIPHPGVDIAAPEGAPIIAPDNGKVVFAGMAGTAGNLVELVTTDGVKHRFMHMSKILVQQGAEVKKGQRIGNVGNTGFSKGAHLHWEKYASGRQVNPLAE